MNAIVPCRIKMTGIVCSVCGRTVTIVLEHTQRHRGEVLRWTECGRCFTDAEQRALESIKAAEKAGA